MKYANVNGVKTHISKVEKGTIGKEIRYGDIPVKACKGRYKQYWKPIVQTTYVYH